jgi:hemolysin activation/secretion protein
MPPPDQGLTEPSPVLAPEDRERPEIDPEAKKIHFEFDELILEDMTSYDPQQIRPIYEDKLGTEISLEELQIIAEDIERVYVQDGYILTRVIIPPQEIDERGVVKLQVIEGFVDNVVIDGNTDTVLNYINAYMEPVLASKPLQISVLERAILLVNDMPGIQTKAVLTPSPNTPGASTLVMVVDQDWFEGSLAADNRGTKYVGPTQLYNMLSANNIFDHVAKTTLDTKVTSNTHELQSFSLRHSANVFKNGSTLELSYTHNRVQPGNDLSNLDIDGKSGTFATIYRYPIIRSRRINLSMYATYDYLNSNTDLLGELLTRDIIESIRAGLILDALDDYNGINLLTVSASQGINLFSGENQKPSLRSRADGTKDYTKLDATYTRLQYLPDRWSIFYSMTGQFAFNGLLSAEEIGYGGEQFGSAYDPSEIVGDSGFLAKLELRYDSEQINELFRSVQYFASYDGGIVWEKHEQVGTPNEQSGTSAAAGIRFGIADRVQGSIEIAKPLTRKVAAYDNKNLRWFFSLTVDIGS